MANLSDPMPGDPGYEAWKNDDVDKLLFDLQRIFGRASGVVSNDEWRAARKRVKDFSEQRLAKG